MPTASTASSSVRPLAALLCARRLRSLSTPFPVLIIRAGQGRVEEVSHLQLRDMSPKAADSEPAAAAARPAKRPRLSEADAERSSRPRVADDEVIDLS